MHRLVLAVAVLAALSGCTVGPNYATPDVPVPARFAEAPAATASGEPPARWWAQLHDPVLDGLIDRALAGNLDLATAKTRIAGARAQEREARAAGLPTLDGSGSLNRIDFSKNAGFSSLARQFTAGGGGGGSGGGSSGGGSTGGGSSGQGIALPGNGITTWSLGLDASWELDLFGGTRRQVEGARARVAAAEWNVRDLQVSVAAEVASDYLMLRSLQAQIAVAEVEIARQQRTLRLITARRQAGLVAELPERQQQLQLRDAAAALPQLQARARDEIHAIGVLTGDGADALSDTLTPAATIPQVAFDLPGGLPSDLLRRRPDIRAAERQLAAATADIGVAVADLYPKFNLMGMAQLISTNLATLFEHASLQTSGTAAVSLPIFDGGRRKGVVAERRAAADEALLTYKKTVLTAVQDVEDALADVQGEQRRNDELKRGVDQAERAERLALVSFNAGLTDFQPVLDAQGSLLTNRNALAQSDATLLTDLARLYKALGGGWT
ncbi:MAG: efflux transporter outer membrane subunit [Sphingomonadaceae bacterium]|nr:efflux transporter outer membrane subunit [Sphingomonadaceae bacterium]